MQHAFGKSATIAALDIGSSKVSCIIAKVSKDKKISVIGYGYNASRGVKKGVITDIGEATIAIGNAVQDAEQMANDVRVKITLACTECKQRNYDTKKNKKNDPDRLELMKYCKHCRKHTMHKETK